MQFVHQQSQVALTRAKTYFADHAAELGVAVNSPPLRRLDDVLRALSETGSAQVVAEKAKLSGTADKKRKRNTLRSGHMVPIASIAMSGLSGIDAKKLEKFKLPGFNANDATVLNHARAMIAGAAEHYAVFVEQQLGDDFVTRFSNAANDFEAAIFARNAEQARRIGASRTLPGLARVVRQLLSVLSGIVESRFYDRPERLAEWYAVIRIPTKPGVARGNLRLLPQEVQSPAVSPSKLTAVA
jgi:hypothetical protein